MSTKYNNNDLSGITFVDSNGGKTVCGVVFNNEKVWGKKRNLYVHYNNNVTDVTVTRTDKGYEPTVSTGVISGTQTQEQYVMRYDVYAGDVVNISAFAKKDYVISDGLGKVTVSSNSDSDIHVYITTAGANVEASGTISKSGTFVHETILVINDRQSSIRVTAMTGNMLKSTAEQLPITVSAYSSGTIVGSSRLVPPMTDYTINLTLSDGTVISCPMTAN